MGLCVYFSQSVVVSAFAIPIPYNIFVVVAVWRSIDSINISPARAPISFAGRVWFPIANDGFEHLTPYPKYLKVIQ